MIAVIASTTSPVDASVSKCDAGCYRFNFRNVVGTNRARITARRLSAIRSRLDVGVTATWRTTSSRVDGPPRSAGRTKG
jgi:hypothetical protein